MFQTVQMEAIKQNKPLMVVGTPGRLAELSRSGALQTHPAGILVLDEVCTPSLLVYTLIFSWAASGSLLAPAVL